MATVFEPDDALELARTLHELSAGSAQYDMAATIREVLAPEDLATLHVLIHVTRERIEARI